VVADRASCSGAELAMARHVPGDPADDRAFDTSLGVRCTEGGQREGGGTNYDRQRFHKRFSDYRRGTIRFGCNMFRLHRELPCFRNAQLLLPWVEPRSRRTGDQERGGMFS
jgi:hypothetical protein